MERRAGIEPASPAWKAGVLPLHKRRDKNYQKIYNSELDYSKDICKLKVFSSRSSKGISSMSL